MASLGALTVSLEANMAQFNRNMDEAAKQTETAGRRMDSAIGMAKVAIASLAGAITVGAFSQLVKGAIDAADNLRDMSQMTGIAVEELSGLAFAASQAGGNLDSMVGAAGKLNKAIVDTANGNGDAKEAFKALGISVIDASGNLKKADEVMADVADQFAKYQDGPEKAALAVALFGKAGADMIPLLNDGGRAMRENSAYAKQYSGQTTDLSNAADNFNDTMGKLEVQQRGFANAVTAQVLPVLQQLSEAILGAAEESRKFDAAAGIIGKSVQILGLTAYNATADFKRFSVVIAGVAEVNSAFYNEGIEGARRAREKINADLLAISNGQTKFLTDMQNGGPKKNPIEQFVAKYSKAIEDEKVLLTTRLQMLNKYRGEEGISDKAYNSAKKAATAEAEKNTRDYYSAQIAGLMAAKTKGIGDPKMIQGQIDQLAAAQSLVGYDKVAAPRLATGGSRPIKLPKQSKIAAAPSQTDEDRLAERSEKIVQSLRAEERALGLVGDAQLRYQLTIDGVVASQLEQALASQKAVIAFRDKEQAVIQNAAAVEQIRAGQMSQAQREAAEHQKTIEQLQIFHAAKFDNIAAANAMIEIENARHEQAKADVKAQTDQMVLSAYSSSTDQLYGLMQQAGLEQTALGKAAFLASKALAVAQIIMNTNAAAASAMAPPPLGLGPVAGLGLATTIKAMGYASAGMTAGLAIAQASAEGGYDIPAGTNPVTQLHEKEMVLPKAQANVIRDLATDGGRSTNGVHVNYAPNIHIDGSTDMARSRQMMAAAVRDGNADLVDRLQRAGRI